jgi:hypothetical protein
LDRTRRLTAWLRMQSDAKRSRGRIFPAICDLQGDFQKLQGEPIQLPATFTMISMGLKQCSWPKEQGAFFGFAGKSREHFWYCREEQRGIANGGRVRRFRFVSMLFPGPTLSRDALPQDRPQYQSRRCCRRWDVNRDISKTALVLGGEPAQLSSKRPPEVALLDHPVGRRELVPIFPEA